MSELERALQAAFETEGSNKEANKAYLEFIKANFTIPIDKSSSENAPEVLYLEESGAVFLPVFTNKESLDQWALDIHQTIKLLKLSGVDLLKGIGDQVTVCLNIGHEFYKEFNPAEIARMKGIVAKFFD